MDCLGTPEYMYYCKYTCIIPGLVYHGFILELLIIAPHQPPPPPRVETFRRRACSQAGVHEIAMRVLLTSAGKVADEVCTRRDDAIARCEEPLDSHGSPRVDASR